VDINSSQKQAIDDLHQFMVESQNPREWKRAESVRLKLLGCSYREIKHLLGVSSSFIAKNHKKFQQDGIGGLKVSYKGSAGYLSSAQKEEVLEWLNNFPDHTIHDLQQHLTNHYQLAFKSKESYYQMLRDYQQKYPRKDRELE
jgi:transposase